MYLIINVTEMIITMEIKINNGLVTVGCRIVCDAHY